MEYHRGIMKVSLAENLRALMVKHLFEKITIKQICDETGVIRATFYNYFEDKYDCLNWIIYHDVIESNEKKLEAGDMIGAFSDLLKTVDANRAFYASAYRNVTGQNSFEDMVRAQFVDLCLTYFKKYRDENMLPQYNDKILAHYYAESLAYIVKLFVFQEAGPMSVEETIQLGYDMLGHSLLDFMIVKKPAQK
ncbi:MAG: TetR/AcrR family transcriptional regulator [Solobacterium sp.]|jgi:probable dihydroxyacetone kinase regulator|nr:TetR/AcrR family transcriptional regulator [Solobacterium sp.]MCH4206439.1 TetR/AcrR family transcriptional regulator [Solobacterium sp.]MCH4227950.1 TetR/AcrR family transcriptional regulator [Solobacterium sp.]MCH4283364.1 TetR/AcrR family transcriptional regulator [Solobacterium sp.]